MAPQNHTDTGQPGQQAFCDDVAITFIPRVGYDFPQSAIGVPQFVREVFLRRGMRINLAPDKTALMGNPAGSGKTQL